ncbi:MAG TPA: rhamnogalacturonan acetylesterase [Candidatus Paceibacterota bacterium]|nr:rhamnogalacturonan acetylesterase [Candidatus Paceibacterota bacterium]
MTKQLSRLFSLGFAASVLCSCKSAGPREGNAVETNAPAIFMIGDSTMANKSLSPAQPERGWGQLLPQYFKPEIRVENLAMNGRSSKSFRDEGRWEPVQKNLKPGDYVIIQFGHNDEKEDPKRHTDAFGSFKQNLERYIRETRELHGNPILATPVVRRDFTNGITLVDTHGDYVVAVRQVASEQKVPLLDLNKETAALVSALGPDLSKKLYMWIAIGEFESLPKGREDNTHFNPYGATRVCDLATEEMKTAVPELAKWLKPAAAAKTASAAK